MAMEREEMKALAREAAKTLGEDQEGPIHQLELILQHAGKDFLDELVAETLKIEENGGMMTDDGKRRRTIGGVFFYLAKGKINPKIRHLIFPGFGQKERGKVIEWGNRLSQLDGMYEEAAVGEVKFHTISIQGRPNKVVVDGASVILTIAHRPSPMPYPRGVPQPPDVVTMYTVYMSTKHWEACQESLEKYKGDRLIIEGSQAFDSETNTIAVFAINVTTKRLQKEGRKEGEEGEEGADGAAPKAPKPAKQQAKPQQNAKPQNKGQGQNKGLPPQNKGNFNKNPNPKQPSKPFIPQAPAPSLPEMDIPLPEGVPADVAAKLRQLHSAAQTLRDRITDMESKGQAGVTMTKTLLKKTEKEIEALEKQYT